MLKYFVMYIKGLIFEIERDNKMLLTYYMKFKYRLLIVFICALFIEITAVYGLIFLEQRNYLGMFFMVFLNPYICLPMNHFNVECKTFKDRFYLATAFAFGFGLGVVFVRPFILE